MEDDYYVDAYCANSSISNPMECEYWYLSNYYIDRTLTFYLNDQVNFNNSQCAITDNTLCIHSNQSTLGMLDDVQSIKESVSIGVIDGDFNGFQ